MTVISNLTRVPEGGKGLKIRGTFDVETAQHEPYIISRGDKGETILKHLEVPPGTANSRTLHFDTKDEAEYFQTKIVTTCRD